MYQDDQNPTQFLVCMTGRLLTRLDRLNEENDLGRMKFIKYHVQLDGLGGVHGLKKRKSTATGSCVVYQPHVRFESEQPGDVPEVCAIAALEELPGGGAFRDSMAASMKEEFTYYKEKSKWDQRHEVQKCKTRGSQWIILWRVTVTWKTQEKN